MIVFYDSGGSTRQRLDKGTVRVLSSIKTNDRFSSGESALCRSLDE
jgi:hypothetical protein